MRLGSLRLVNYRRFRDATLEFPDGVTALVGKNGAGKSTLLEALAWAIYGHDAARTGKDLIKRRGAGPAEDVRVELRFTHAGNAYEVVRQLRGASQSHVAELSVDGRVVVPAGANAHREVTAYLERALHLDKHAFFTSLVARQRDLNALSDMTPGARKKVVLAMLRIDAVDDAVARARADRRDRLVAAATLAESLADPKALEARRLAAAEARAVAASRRDALAVEAEGLNAVVEAARSDVRALEAKARDHHVLASRLSEARGRLAALDGELATLAREAAAAEAARAELATFGEAEAAYDAARVEVERRRAAAEKRAARARRVAERDRLAASLAAVERDLVAKRGDLEGRGAERRLHDRAVAALAAAREARAAIARERAVALSEARGHAEVAVRARDRRARIESLGPATACPTCARPLGAHLDEVLGTFDREVEAALAREREAKARAAAKEAEDAAKREEERALVEREAELARKVRDLAMLEGAVPALAARVAEERARLDALDLDLDLARDVLEPDDPQGDRAASEALAAALRRRDRARALAPVAARRDAIAERRAVQAEVARGLQVEAEELGRRLAALAFSDRALADASDRFDRAKTAREEARIGIERAQAAVDRADADLAAVAREVEANAARSRERDEHLAAAALLERLAGDRDQGLLVEFKNSLVSRIRPALGLYAGALFRELTEGRYADIEVDEDYDLAVVDDGVPYPLARFSGGEGDLANLCLRLAVSQVLAERAGGADFGFLALDEVFGSQDDARKANILRAMGRLSSQFRQILLITHVDDVKESVDRVVRVVDLADGSSDLEAS
ncbi:MAG TPA: SMC family ATPase [Candidatus Thermoplasmatota archaeon]|nr:SMC family ATPase [Candidatus Thermoplasmatota archaeon]